MIVSPSIHFDGLLKGILILLMLEQDFQQALVTGNDFNGTFNYFQNGKFLFISHIVRNTPDISLEAT